jgi:hypothetical protein
MQISVYYILSCTVVLVLGCNWSFLAVVKHVNKWIELNSNSSSNSNTPHSDTDTCAGVIYFQTNFVNISSIVTTTTATTTSICPDSYIVWYYV